MAKRKQHRNRRRNDVAETASPRPARGPGNAAGKAAGKGSSRSSREGRQPGKGRDWLFGTHAVLAAIENPDRDCTRLLATADARGSAEAALKYAREQGLSRPEPAVVERAQISRHVPEGAVHQGLAMETAPLPAVFIGDIIHELKDTAPALVVVIDQGTDPRNVGSVMRSAAAFGASAVIVQDRHSPAATGHLAKAASGALETVPLVRVANLSRALEQLKDAEFWRVGLDGAATDSTASLDWPHRTALILGSEGSGLRRLTRDHCDFLVRIPMTERMESLNLSTAAAIALYEAFRQNQNTT